MKDEPLARGEIKGITYPLSKQTLQGMEAMKNAKEAALLQLAGAHNNALQAVAELKIADMELNINDFSAGQLSKIKAARVAMENAQKAVMVAFESLNT